MPSVNKIFSRKLGRWVNQREKGKNLAEAENIESLYLIISVFTWYPDFLLDLCRSKNAEYKTEALQRFMLRIMARYKNVHITGSRGTTKTTVLMEAKSIDGARFPREKIRYVAPSQRQSATLASSAFKQFAHDYPVLAKSWAISNDRQDLFKITTRYNSEFTMYAPRGDNSSQLVAEEMGAEGEDGFDMATYENDISPACRIERKVGGVIDPVHLNLKEVHILNACSRQNRAYSTYRANALKDMISGNDGDGYAVDIPWVCSLLCNIRSIDYFKKERRKLSPEDWAREMEAHYIGNDENPLITDEQLTRSRKLAVAELGHCGNPDAIYIVAHDVSYKDSSRNAKCADVVLKLTRFSDPSKKDKYRKQVVFVDNYPPLLTYYDQAVRLKNLWKTFCLNGGQTTYIVTDAQSYGTAVVEELVKPMGDGIAMCTIGHTDFAEIEQPNALPVIYAMKASVRGSRDPDSDMIQYAQGEFRQGNVELLCPNILDGVEAYRNHHGIKDNTADSTIALPYKQTELLCQEIANLCTKPSGMTLKEDRKSKFIQRDLWSALKYALRMAQKLEAELATDEYASQSSWGAMIDNYAQLVPPPVMTGSRARLLALRKGR